MCVYALIIYKKKNTEKLLSFYFIFVFDRNLKSTYNGKINGGVLSLFIHADGSLWSMIDISAVPVNYNKVEELFCQKQKSDATTNSTVPAQPKIQEINLLDSRRSLTINIFLKQFKDGPKVIFNAINNRGGLESEKLRGLKRILPDSEEVSRFYTTFFYL